MTVRPRGPAGSPRASPVPTDPQGRASSAGRRTSSPALCFTVLALWAGVAPLSAAPYGSRVYALPARAELLSGRPDAALRSSESASLRSTSGQDESGGATQEAHGLRPPAGGQAPESVLWETRAPFTYLFDTGSSLPAPLPARPETGSWAVLPEETLTHVFAGDTVFLNDRLVVVLRKGGAGAEVYSKTEPGLRQRTLLIPSAGEGGTAAGLSAIRIVENTPAAVTVEATYQTEAGGSVSATFRLTTGETFLETRAGQGTRKLIIQASTRYVIVPDFFADDMVFGPKTFDLPHLGLPTENFFLSLLEGGDAILMCIWQSNERDAGVTFSGEGPARAVTSSACLQCTPGLPERTFCADGPTGKQRVAVPRSCDVECVRGESIWVACLESPNIWHSRPLSAEDVGADVLLGWRPPFPAKWRGSFVRGEGVGESYDFEQEKEATYVFPGRGETVYPCWFDSDRAFVRVPPLLEVGRPQRRAGSDQGYIVVYPIDRSRSTPLTVFCPIDVMRNTLGVGPCQYVLRVEGLDSEAPATPEEVTHWVERQFERKRDARESEAIRERLSQMTSHVEHTQARIERYTDFARQVQQRCAEAEGNASTADLAGTLSRTADDMARSIELRRGAMKTPEVARQLADGMVGLIGTENALAECRRLGAELRSIGAAQDNTLGKCRMAVRWLRQQCRMAAEPDGRAADLAGEVQEQAEQMLRKK